MKRKWIALGMAGIMVMAPMTVCAEEGTDTGNGTVEGIVDLDVYDVELPTTATDVFDFKLDPQGLIFETSGEAYSGMAPAEGTTVVFTNYDENGDATAMSDTSDAVVVKNLGSVSVDVTVTATVTSALEMSADDTFADDGQLYLALKGSDNAEAAVDTTTKVATLKAVMNGIAADNFEYTYDSTDGYEYTLKDDYDQTTAPSYSFQLTGAADANADWVGDETADVEVVWSLEKSSSVAAYAMWDTNATIWMGKDASTGFDGTTLTSFSINGTTTDKATLADGWISIPWAEIDAIDGDNPSAWNIEAVIDGVTYTASL